MFDDYVNHINSWTKEVLAPNDYDLCNDSQIKPAVKELYDRYKPDCNRFVDVYGMPSFDAVNRRYYVYAWHTKTSPKMYFYVGKGTRQRYNHVLKEISDYRCGKIKSNSRFKWYTYLQDKFDIECEIVINDLSEYEAIVYEQALKIHMCKNGEALLNVEGIPFEYLPDGWQNKHVDIPTIENSRLYRRYYDYESVPSFDSVDISCLERAYFYSYGTGRDIDVQIEEEIIERWINTIQGKIYTSGTAKGVQSIIVFRYLSEERYRAFRDCGKHIYSSLEVMNVINNC